MLAQQHGADSSERPAYPDGWPWRPVAVSAAATAGEIRLACGDGRLPLVEAEPAEQLAHLERGLDAGTAVATATVAGGSTGTRITAIARIGFLMTNVLLSAAWRLVAFRADRVALPLFDAGRQDVPPNQQRNLIATLCSSICDESNTASLARLCQAVALPADVLAQQHRTELHKAVVGARRCSVMEGQSTRLRLLIDTGIRTPIGGRPAS